MMICNGEVNQILPGLRRIKVLKDTWPHVEAHILDRKKG